jgi:DNA-directed RNA polymerase alpha subunit
MYTKFAEPILNKPIAELEISTRFSMLCEIAGFNTLGDLLDRHTSELLKLPGFSYHIIGEYIEFLERYHVAHHLDGR